MQMKPLRLMHLEERPGYSINAAAGLNNTQT